MVGDQQVAQMVIEYLDSSDQVLGIVGDEDCCRKWILFCILQFDLSGFAFQWYLLIPNSMLIYTSVCLITSIFLQSIIKALTLCKQIIEFMQANHWI